MYQRKYTYTCTPIYIFEQRLLSHVPKSQNQNIREMITSETDLPATPPDWSKADGRCPSLPKCYHQANPRTGVRWGCQAREFFPWVSNNVRGHDETFLWRIRTCGNVRVISDARRSAMPVNWLPPPVSTILPARTWRNSMSQVRRASPMRAMIFLGRFALEAYVHICMMR